MNAQLFIHLLCICQTPSIFHSGIMQMYLVGNSFYVSFIWVVIISTKREAAHKQSVKVSTCYTLWHFGDWLLITGRGGGGLGGTTSFEVVLTWELEVLAIVIGGGAQKVSTL